MPNTKRKRLANPLALAVMVLLQERQMHPYEMAATLKERGKEHSIKLHYGSLYTVIDQLLREGYVEAAETTRDGRRPERTTYQLTPAGKAEMHDWLSELVGQPVKEFPRFEAALSFLPALPPAEALTLLKRRRELLAAEEDRIRGCLQSVPVDLPRLFLVESDYYLAMLQAESRFVADLIDGIESERLTGVTMWKGWHQQ